MKPDSTTLMKNTISSGCKRATKDKRKKMPLDEANIESVLRL